MSVFFYQRLFSLIFVFAVFMKTCASDSETVSRKRQRVEQKEDFLHVVPRPSGVVKSAQSRDIQTLETVVSEDGSTFLSIVDSYKSDAKIYVGDMKTGCCAGEYITKNNVDALALSSTGTLIALATHKALQLFSKKKSLTVPLWGTKFDEAIKAVTWSPDEKHFAVGTDKGAVVLYDRVHDDFVRRYTIPILDTNEADCEETSILQYLEVDDPFALSLPTDETISALAWAKNNHILCATTNKKKQLLYIDAQQEQSNWYKIEHRRSSSSQQLRFPEYAERFVLDPDHTYFLAAGPTSIYLYNLKNKQYLHTFEVSPYVFTNAGIFSCPIAWDKTGRNFFFASNDSRHVFIHKADVATQTCNEVIRFKKNTKDQIDAHIPCVVHALSSDTLQVWDQQKITTYDVLSTVVDKNE